MAKNTIVFFLESNLKFRLLLRLLQGAFTEGYTQFLVYKDPLTLQNSEKIQNILDVPFF